VFQACADAGDFVAPCLPPETNKLPSGSQWLHEIKHDGFRIIVRGVIRLRAAKATRSRLRGQGKPRHPVQ